MSERDRRLTRHVSAWFRATARDLPWRRRRDGYTALVAEAMLQQTQAARVIEPFEAFLRRFPTVQALAAADEQDVLAAWQGLGYYRRARHLHVAARMIVEQFGGHVPPAADDLRSLPGVGRYTAGSIASIVFGRREPIVDGNVRRVLARWEADDAPPDDRATLDRTWDRAAALVEAAADPGCFNEGLMELGALICTPAKPKCGACPVAADCRAWQQGQAGEIPSPRAAARRTPVHFHTVIIERSGSVLLEQRAWGGLWSGMWQTPTVEWPRALSTAQVRGRLEVRVTDLNRLSGFEYRTTHRQITFHVFRGRTRQRRGTWRESDRLVDLPMSNAMRRVLAVADEAAC
jgi:A/G-specific adenine glycosylase